MNSNIGSIDGKDYKMVRLQLENIQSHLENMKVSKNNRFDLKQIQKSLAVINEIMKEVI